MLAAILEDLFLLVGVFLLDAEGVLIRELFEFLSNSESLSLSESLSSITTGTKLYFSFGLADKIE